MAAVQGLPFTIQLHIMTYSHNQTQHLQTCSTADTCCKMMQRLNALMPASTVAPTCQSGGQQTPAQYLWLTPGLTLLKRNDSCCWVQPQLMHAGLLRPRCHWLEVPGSHLLAAAHRCWCSSSSAGVPPCHQAAAGS